ncbi:MAG: serine protease [Bacteroidales bacterium]|jgi:Na+-transporting methylmalonyl-CoA/oxaloacetate decarboxylase gamma subunit|nr:serine protease [Bacteroidales bacterium]
MFELYSNLDLFMKIYWVIAIFSSVVFIVQAIMTFVGGGAGDLDVDSGVDVETGDMPFHLFSFRNLINFLLGFSWTGISLNNVIHNRILLNVVAVLVGFLFIFLFFLIIKQLMKLSENNSFNIEETIGKTADVYLTIPAERQGKGKVMVSVRGTVHELSAITDNGEKFETGNVVKITQIINNLVIVEKL